MAKKEKKSRDNKRKEKQKSVQKKRMPTVPEHQRPVICPPDGAGRGPVVRILGYACRCFVVMCLCWALMMFFGGAFTGPYEYSVCVSNVTMLGLAAFATAVLGLICYNRYTALGGLVLGGVGFAVMAPNVIQGVLALYNGFLCRLYLSKFTVYLSTLGIGVPGMTAGDALAAYYKQQLSAYGEDGMLVMALVLAAILVPLVARRTRPVLPLLTCLAVIVPVCVFNIAASNLGAGMLIASICAVLVMWAYDKMFRRAPDANKYDTKLQLFSEQGKPAYPEEYLQRIQAKRDKKQQAKAARLAKREQRKHKKDMTVEDELSQYVTVKPKRKPKAAKVRLTDEQKAAQKQQKKERKQREKEIRRQVRLVRRYEQVTDSAKRAMGGFASAVMLAVSLLIVIIPTLVVDDYMVIELLDEKISYVRAYVTATLMGDDERLDELEYELDQDNFKPHSTTAEHLQFDGTQFFYIESQYATNLYLKGWIGVDYRDGAWYTGQASADPEQPGAFEAWREMYALDSMPAEQMFYDFYWMQHPELEIFDPEYDFLTKYHKYGDYGFTAVRVHMRRVNSPSSLLALPTVTDPGRGLYGYGNNEQSEHSFVNYFDGTLTGRDFTKAGTKYSAMTFAPIKTDKDWIGTLGADIAYYNLQKELILAYNSYEIEQMSYGPSVNPTYTVKVEKDTPAKGFVTVSYRRGGKVVDTFVHPTEHITYTSQESLVIRDANGSYTVSLDRNNKVVGVETDATDSLFHRYVSGKDSDKREIDRILFGGSLEAEEDGKTYTDYVYTFYTGKSDSRIIADIASHIRKNATYEVREETGEFEHIEAVTHEEYRLAEGEIDLSGQTAYYHKIVETDENGEQTERYELVTDLAGALDTDLYHVVVVVDEEAYDLPIYAVTEYPYDFTVADVRGATFAQATEQRNDLVMAVIDHIIEELGCEYTLTPDLESVDPDLDGVENFLSVTKQGYCVQFASAVCLILREYGIPARYVEGYIACDFNINRADTAVGRFSTYVHDYEAHAWVEVFFDGIGWVQYECTPAYYAGMYGGNDVGGGSNDNSSSTPPPSIQDQIQDMIGDYEKNPDEEDVSEEELLEQQQRRKTIIASIIAVAVLAVAALIIWVLITLKNRAASAQSKRDMAADTVLSEHFGQNTSEDDRRELSYTVIDALTDLLDIYGLAPEPGEFKDEYAHRVAVDLEDVLGRSPEYELPTEEEDPNAPAKDAKISPHRMGRIMDGIAAEEFGHGMSIAEMKQVAALYRDLYANVGKRVPALRRAVLRYIKNRL